MQKCGSRLGVFKTYFKAIIDLLPKLTCFEFKMTVYIIFFKMKSAQICPPILPSRKAVLTCILILALDPLLISPSMEMRASHSSWLPSSSSSSSSSFHPPLYLFSPPAWPRRSARTRRQWSPADGRRPALVHDDGPSPPPPGLAAIVVCWKIR